MAHILDTLRALATDVGYESREDDEGLLLLPQRQITGVRVSPLSDDEAFVYLVYRTSSWDLDGDRTDAHDIFPVLLAAFVRYSSPRNYSVALWDVDHPFAEGELYARYLTLAQPDNSVVRATEQSLADFRHLLQDVHFFGLIFPHQFEWERGPEKAYSYCDSKLQEWAERCASLLKESLDDQVQRMRRWGPDWFYYRSASRRISIIRAPRAAALVSALARSGETGINERTLAGIRHQLYVSSRIKAAVPLRVIARARRMLAGLQNGEAHAAAVVPLESHVLFAGESHLLVIRQECGIQSFKSELSRVEARHRGEASWLFPATRFEWAETPNDDDFEQLVRDLLSREEGVIRVRKCGHSRDSDGGGDLLVDWSTPPVAGSSVADKSAPLVIRKVIVQVKVSSRSINKHKVQDIRDTMEHYEAAGYFLAVSSQLTSDLTDHLQRMRSSGNYWTDWWNRSEIEERLNKYPEVADRYPRVLRRIN